MKIPFKELAKIEGATQKVAVQTSLLMVRRYWCAPMTTRRDCTEHCPDCQGCLEKIFENINSASGVRNYEALLTWVIRNAQAEFADKKQAERVTPTPQTWYGEAADVDALALLSKEFGL